MKKNVFAIVLVAFVLGLLLGFGLNSMIGKAIDIAGKNQLVFKWPKDAVVLNPQETTAGSTAFASLNECAAACDSDYPDFAYAGFLNNKTCLCGKSPEAIAVVAAQTTTETSEPFDLKLTKKMKRTKPSGPY